LERGVRMHYLLRGDRYWGNVLDEAESRIVEMRLKHEKVQLHFFSEIAEILGRRGRVSGVRIIGRDSKEETLRCDIVGAAIGVRPQAGLAQDAGLRVERGILVNDRLQTSAEDIFAAGDVAQVYDPLTGKHVLDTLWSTAREQGRAAGLNMAGVHAPFKRTIPFNVTRLAGLTTTIIGVVGRGPDADVQGIVRGDSETWRQLPDAIAAQTQFDVNRLRLMIGQRTLLGAVVMGDQTLSRPLEDLIGRQVDITPIREQLQRPGAPLGELITNYWMQTCYENK
jgi:NADPH-dependent 2,4-dienoyl-CoA reductase/sulfur reductase-like enzyme